MKSMTVRKGPWRKAICFLEDFESKEIQSESRLQIFSYFFHDDPMAGQESFNSFPGGVQTSAASSWFGLVLVILDCQPVY